MMRTWPWKDGRGMTLVELLVVVAILGLVVGSMYSLYINTRRTAYTEDEVVQLQQSLRVAMQSLTRDIRLAGFCLSSGDPVTFDPGRLEIRTASASGKVARIASDFSLPSGLDTNNNAILQIAEADMVDLFEKDDTVGLIRPAKKKAAVNLPLTVESVNREVPRITVTHEFLHLEKKELVEGDLIIMAGEVFPAPDVIRYSINGTDLVRSVNPDSASPPTPQTVARNITEMDLVYLNENGEATTSSKEIAAVQVTLTGVTLGNLSEAQGNTRTRKITNVIRIHN